jgi:CheY-like chemotaxis protein
MYDFSKIGRVYAPSVPNNRAVLCMDDEPHVLDVTAEIMCDLGYKVLTTENGAHGLEVFKNEPGISLVVSDIMMPRMTGVEAYREMRKIRVVPAVFMTGYAEKALLDEISGYGVDILWKPFRMATLTEKVLNLTGLNRP